jgi:glycosyltransferase involved in cell wall biosynthesis
MKGTGGPASATSPADVVLAGLSACAALPWLLACALAVRWRRPAAAARRRLLVLDCAYSLGVLRQRQMEHVVTFRDFDGFFDHVWTVHPLVGASPDDPPDAGVGPVAYEALDSRHTMVEGKVARLGSLARFPTLNFVLAQAGLLRSLMRLLRRARISAILILDPYYLGLLGYALARIGRVPLVLLVNANHDALYELTGALAYPRLLRRRSVEQRIARFVFPRLATVIAGSANNAEFAVANGALPERVGRVYRGASIHPLHLAPLDERGSVSAELGLGERPFLICVSRLEPAKHAEDVLDVLHAVRAREPSVAAVLVGDGSLRGALESRARELGLAEHVRFTGNRDQPWVAAALREASVVLAPLAGRALLEAALSATPIVAYDYEWHRELIRDGETGVLVAYRDTEAMSAAVVDLISDPARAERLGTRARSEIAALKDPQAVAAEYRAHFEKLEANAA